MSICCTEFIKAINDGTIEYFGIEQKPWENKTPVWAQNGWYVMCNECMCHAISDPITFCPWCGHKIDFKGVMKGTTP